MSWLSEFKVRRKKERTVIQFNLDLDYVVPAHVRDQPKSIAETNPILTRHLLEQALFARFPATIEERTGKPTGGLEGASRKLWGKIQNAMNRAVEKAPHVMSITEDQFEFLRKTLDSWNTLPGGFGGYFATLDDYMDEVALSLKNEKSEAEKNGASKPEKAKV